MRVISLKWRHKGILFHLESKVHRLYIVIANARSQIVHLHAVPVTVRLFIFQRIHLYRPKHPMMQSSRSSIHHLSNQAYVQIHVHRSIHACVGLFFLQSIQSSLCNTVTPSTLSSILVKLETSSDSEAKAFSPRMRMVFRQSASIISRLCSGQRRNSSFIMHVGLLLIALNHWSKVFLNSPSPA